ncbi:MAG: ABC transporter permease [Alphaproteobacteria bacterium]|jgi:simple sugar transport system permease protein|nr:ABC transporter permease [Alphaproteobacteria bacterium]
MDEIMITVASLAASTLRVATPMILAALGGLFSERAGIANIALEGKMLGAAFAAAAVAALSGSAVIGLGAGILVAVLLSLVHGYACITHNGDQVVSGMAINIMVAGLAPTLALAWFQQGGQTPILSGAQRFAPIILPFSDVARDVPLFGPLYARVLSDQTVLVYVALLAVPLAAWVLYRTRFGLRLRAVGENPHAVDTAGISVAGMRFRALIIAGVLCGIAGAYMSTAHGAAFVRDMTAGKGFLALAALIFGKWRPVPTMLACLLFAFADAVQVRLQGTVLPGIGVVPVQAIQALPYVLTVVLLAGFVGKSAAPKAIGLPFVKDR